MSDETPIDKLTQKVEDLNVSVVNLSADFKTFPREMGLAVGQAQVKHVEEYHQEKEKKKPSVTPGIVSIKTDMGTLVKYALYLASVVGAGAAGKAFF